jgi:hypothetical protein
MRELASRPWRNRSRRGNSFRSWDRPKPGVQLRTRRQIDIGVPDAAPPRTSHVLPLVDRLTGRCSKLCSGGVPPMSCRLPPKAFRTSRRMMAIAAYLRATGRLPGCHHCPASV